MPQRKTHNPKPAAPKAQKPPDQTAIHSAIFNFQMKFPGVEKTRVNTFTGSKYASLDDIMRVAQPLLTELELVVIYEDSLVPTPDGGGYLTVMSCQILHLPSGEFVKSHLPLPDISDGAQSVGSYMTYWRRYLFSGLTNICEAADDDGNATMPVEQGATKMTEKQHSEILDFVDATNTKMGDADTEGTLMHHISVTTNLTEMDQLSSRQASTILKMLKTKYKRQREEAS